ncbi:MAG: DUF4124 domain-containing protein [Thermodesulfobacteriota bacterium]|nr:DUF4124 domain-containing protein [Thermodesulfobacteriota bacterium]
MERLLIAVMLVSVVILAGAPGIAELYKYTDDNGQVHYTNSLANVPRQLRNEIIEDKEIQSTPPVEREPATEDRKPSERQPQGGNDSLNKKHGDLVSRKAALEKKREALEKKRQALEARGKNITSRTERKRYNEQVTELNQAYEALHKEEMALKKELSEYNRRVEKSLTEKLEAVRQHNSSDKAGKNQ